MATPRRSREEWIGLAAVMVLGLLALVAATELEVWGIRIGAAMDVTPSASGSGTGLPVLMILVGVILDVAALAFLILPWLPGRDDRRGPPRGFTTVSAVFDVIWKIVGGFLSLFRWYW